MHGRAGQIARRLMMIGPSPDGLVPENSGRAALIVSLIMVVFFLLSSSCATVPITGRKQLSIIPGSQMLSRSYQEYGEFLKSNKLSTDRAQAALVQKVGRRKGSVEKYFAQNNMSDRLKDYRWLTGSMCRSNCTFIVTPAVVTPSVAVPVSFIVILMRGTPPVVLIDPTTGPAIVIENEPSVSPVSLA